MYVFNGMANRFLIKKILVLSFLFACLVGEAANKTDSVVMTVAGKSVSLDEFIFMLRKNSDVDLSEHKSLESYVELYKNFKLKVAEAESLGLDKTKEFADELEGYRAQLTSGYLSDHDGEEAAVRAEYDRLGDVLELSHILFRLPEKTVSKDTVAVYNKAMKAYERIKNGEDISVCGKDLAEMDTTKQTVYEYVRCFMPLQTLKVFENAAYSMKPGEVSMPVRSALGFHIIKLHNRKPNPGMCHVAHILISFQKDSVMRSEEEALALAEDVYRKAQGGADFKKLAEEYSSDRASARQGGEVPWFGVGEMVELFEKGAFALNTPGELSKPIKTRFGYHIIKLIEKRAMPSFDEKKKEWSRIMSQGEHNFEYYKAFDERMKKEYGYVFYPEAYAELQALCDDYFPTDEEFYEKAKNMNKTLIHLVNTDFPQSEFAGYIRSCPFSTKTYSGDFMQEVFDLFVRDITTAAERKNLDIKHPEYKYLMQEYRDGILLFNISTQKVWSKPAGEQPDLEKSWLKELSEKYPVTINWKLLKKLKK